MTWASSKKYKSLQESEVIRILDHKTRVHISALHNEGKNNKREKRVVTFYICMYFCIFVSVVMNSSYEHEISVFMTKL